MHLERSCALWTRIVCLLALGTTASSAAPAPKATRDGILQLTSANWTTEITKGAYLIEFFSPYCKHCKSFFPTWDELVTNKEFQRISYPDAPFTLAQVDCFAQQDICVDQKVQHFPRLTIYRDGVQQPGEYQGDREYTALSSFIDREAEHYRKSKGVSQEPHPLAENPHEALPLANQPQKDAALPQDVKDRPPPAQAPVAAAPDAPAPPQPPKDDAGPAREEEALLPKGPNPKGEVISFGTPGPIQDSKSLEHMLSKDSGSGSCFVKFFAPWCPHCKAMANAYGQVADALKGRVNVLEVDCERYSSVCAKYGIQSFPTLRMYNEGEATEYKGGRGFESMKTWAIKAGAASGVREIKADEIEGFRRDEEVFFLYIHQAGTPQREVDAVTRASRILLTTPVHVYRTTDGDLVSRYQGYLSKGSKSGTTASAGALSGLLVFKDSSAVRPTATYYPSGLEPALSFESAVADVAEWLDKERYATVIELTGNNFNDVINNKQGAPVVLAALSDVHHSGSVWGTGTGAALRDQELKVLKELARGWRERGGGGAEGTAAEATRQRQERVLFAWIDADRWASAIQQYYNIKSKNVPKLILADGSRLQYYDLPSHFSDPYSQKKKPWLDSHAIFDALDLIWRGKGAKPKSSRTYLDQGVRGANGALASLRHPFFSILFIFGLIGAVVSYLRKHADQRASQSSRLPYGKAD